LGGTLPPKTAAGEDAFTGFFLLLRKELSGANLPPVAGVVGLWVAGAGGGLCGSLFSGFSSSQMQLFDSVGKPPAQFPQHLVSYPE
jgi:hypothetical protein